MTATTAAPVRFTQRPDRALLLGLSATRAIALAACVIAVAVVTVMSGVTAGLITATGTSPVAGSALLIVEGRALIEWAPDAARYAWRGANGRLRVLARPDRPMPVGVLPIPGTAQQLTVFAATDGSAILHDRAADTWTAVASVAGGGFLYADAETQDAAAAGFGRALAAIGSDGQIQRIHITHRTRPDAGAEPTAVRIAASARSLSPTATAAYHQTLDQHGVAWRHDTLIAITLGGKTARAAIRRDAGHGHTAAAHVLAAHRDSLPKTLDNADVSVESWLTPSDLAVWIRSAYDPASIPITNLHPAKGDDAGAAGIAASGPMAVAETWSTLRTDSAFHQTLWVSQWPRFDTHPAFLAPLILPAVATVTISLVYYPIPTPVALRQIGRDKTAQASDAALRRRIGTLDSAEQAAREADTLQREADLAEGHVDMRHTALIAITATTRDQLTDAATRIRQHAAAAGCETRVLYGQQLAALNAAIVPADLRL